MVILRTYIKTALCYDVATSYLSKNKNLSRKQLQQKQQHQQPAIENFEKRKQNMKWPTKRKRERERKFFTAKVNYKFEYWTKDPHKVSAATINNEELKLEEFDFKLYKCMEHKTIEK